MCGRYVSVSTPEQLAETFEVDEVRTDNLGQRFNVAPSLEVYAVIDRDERRALGALRWGFVPFWTKKLKGARTPINARLETVHETKMFADSFAARRCLIPADGFYEWKEPSDHSKKTPYFIHDPDDEPFGFAGIWTVWRESEDSEPLYSCAIVTTAAKGPMTELHHRMPLIVPRRLWSTYLDDDGEVAPTTLHEMLMALDAPRFEAYPVSTDVNNVRNDGPELLEPA